MRYDVVDYLDPKYPIIDSFDTEIDADLAIIDYIVGRRINAHYEFVITDFRIRPQCCVLCDTEEQIRLVVVRGRPPRYLCLDCHN